MFKFPFALLSLCFVAVLPVFVTSLTPAPDVTNLTRRAQAATLYSHCTKENTVALTFDDGPSKHLISIVDQLDAANAKGTFFFNGDNDDCIYNKKAMERVQYAYKKGHMIGSHTWFHKDLTDLTRDQIDDGMFRVEQAFERITGAKPAFMRPPFGEYNDKVLEVAGDRNQGVVLWDLDSGDSLGVKPSTSKKRYDAAIKKHPNNLLALNHDMIGTTADEVLPYILPKLKEAGYTMVTVADCLGLPPYQSEGSPQTPDESWTCETED